MKVAEAIYSLNDFQIRDISRNISALCRFYNIHFCALVNILIGIIATSVFRTHIRIGFILTNHSAIKSD